MLIEKDKKPNWKYKNVYEIDPKELEWFFEELDEDVKNLVAF